MDVISISKEMRIWFHPDSNHEVAGLATKSARTTESAQAKYLAIFNSLGYVDVHPPPFLNDTSTSTGGASDPLESSA